MNETGKLIFDNDIDTTRGETTRGEPKEQELLKDEVNQLKEYE